VVVVAAIVVAGAVAVVVLVVVVDVDAVVSGAPATGGSVAEEPAPSEVVQPATTVAERAKNVRRDICICR
jgi:hypothetical protein